MYCLQFPSNSSKFLLLLCTCLITSKIQSAQDVNSFVLQGATILDVRTGEEIQDSAILIENGRIKQISSITKMVVPNQAIKVDVRGKFVIPGLIDMHVHGSARGDVALELYIANGVTTIRDLGGNLASLRTVQSNIDSNKKFGPHLFFAGNILDGVPPSAPSISIIVDTPTQAQSAVNFLADQGVDTIKIYNNIAEPLLAQIIQAAHNRDLPVGGHVPHSVPLKRAIELGIDFIEHSPIRAIDLVSWNLMTEHESNQLATLSSVTQREALVWRKVELNSNQIRNLISLLAESKVFFDPTLSIDEFDSLFLYQAEAKHPNNRFLKRAFLDEALGPDHDIFEVPPEMKGLAEAGIEKRRQFVGMCNRAGVQILAGTDGPGIGRLTPGFGLHHELSLLVKAGLTPFQSIQAATIRAASAMKKEKEIGSIETGKLADLIVLNANPLVDINNSKQIHAVVKAGKLLDRKMLDSLFSAAEAMAKN